jgi:putative aldouronate transport system permease protein
MKSFDSKADKALIMLDYILMTLLAFVMLYPFWDMMILSISPRSEVFTAGFRFFTLHPDFTAYKKVLTSTEIWQGLYNSIVRVLLGTTISLILTALTAYPLSKKRLPLNKLFTWIFLLTMMFSGGLIPGYLLIKNLGMLNTIWSLVIPSSVSAFNLIIMRNFLRFIPESLEESAMLDGAKEFTIWWRIVLPLSKPVLATLALWVAVDNWNSYFDALIYITDRSKYVLPIIMRRVLLENQITAFIGREYIPTANSAKPTDESLKAAIVMFGTLPIVLVYPFLQKYFMKGIMLGAVKG